jgi:hypothetical protein
LRYNVEEQVEEQIFTGKPLLTHTTREDILNLTDMYIAENSVSWKQCVDICIDTAQSMVQKTYGYIAHVKATAPECISSHCIIH